MKTLVFLLEEQSARVFLAGILPRLLPPEIQIQYIVFQGKQDLERNLTKKLKHWLLPDSYFIVIRDQDAANCLDVKSRLLDLCQQSGRRNYLVRIACRELESFYLGDLQAVEQGLGIKGLSRQQTKRKFRNPDLLVNPAKVLTELTQNKYSKTAGSRLISPYLNLDENLSKSFLALVKSIQRLTLPKDSHGFV